MSASWFLRLWALALLLDAVASFSSSSSCATLMGASSQQRKSTTTHSLHYENGNGMRKRNNLKKPATRNHMDTTPATYQRLESRRYSSGRLPLPSSAASSSSWIYLSLLSLQFGLQPILTKLYTPQNVMKSSVVLAQDVVRFLFCGMAFFLVDGGSGGGGLLTPGGHKSGLWLLLGGGASIPAVLYMIQNYCSLMGYQALPPITYNILNQTKTLSAALCCYLIMGKPQSLLQLVSLALLLLSALVIEQVIPLPTTMPTNERSQKETTANKAQTPPNRPRRRPSREQIVKGVIPVLVASLLSGLAGAMSQRTLQIDSRNSYLFSMELSFFSILFMSLTLMTGLSPDTKRFRKQCGRCLSRKGNNALGDDDDDDEGFGWNSKTWIPVVTNAYGGLLVGLVTKYAGAVQKGFALIFGLIISGIAQQYVLQIGDGKLSSEQILGGALASISMWMHSRFPSNR